MVEGEENAPHSNCEQCMCLHCFSRYDKLLGAFRSPGKQQRSPAVSVVGVTIMSDVLLGAAMAAYLQETVCDGHSMHFQYSET